MPKGGSVRKLKGHKDSAARVANGGGVAAPLPQQMSTPGGGSGAITHRDMAIKAGYRNYGQYRSQQAHERNAARRAAQRELLRKRRRA